ADILDYDFYFASLRRITVDAVLLASCEHTTGGMLGIVRNEVADFVLVRFVGISIESLMRKRCKIDTSPSKALPPHKRRSHRFKSRVGIDLRRNVRHAELLCDSFEGAADALITSVLSFDARFVLDRLRKSLPNQGSYHGSDGSRYHDFDQRKALLALSCTLA